MEDVKIENIREVVLDDPVELARIDKLEREADRDVARLRARRKRSAAGGRVLHMWVNTKQQAELEKLAERDHVTLNVAAKHLLEEALAAAH